jgi:hypothetical protein
MDRRLSGPLRAFQRVFGRHQEKGLERFDERQFRQDLEREFEEEKRHKSVMDMLLGPDRGTRWHDINTEPRHTLSVRGRRERRLRNRARAQRRSLRVRKMHGRQTRTLK